jgi:RNA polymerase sigma-70 factor (ECF subfamily)
MTQNYFDAEDLTQETFLAVYKALPEFDGENPGGFVTRIATNKCLDYLKKAERRTVVADDELFAKETAKNAEPEKLFLEKEVTQELQRVCSSLKSPYREVALAYYCQEQTSAQIAKTSGRKIKTIQTQLRRAKTMLQKQLKKSS